MATSAEGQVLGKFVMPFDLGRSLVDCATQGLVQNPLQQVCCPYRIAEFLQCQSKSIPGAVTVDLRQDRGRCERAALDRQRKLHELWVVLMDQRPVDRAGKKRVDPCV